MLNIDNIEIDKIESVCGLILENALKRGAKRYFINIVMRREKTALVGTDVYCVI